MADLSLATLTAPIDDEDPCGPDLDLEEDDAYVNFVSATEMVLPDEYMIADHKGDRRPFHLDDRFKDLDFDARLTAAGRLVPRTQDLRLLFIVAKLQILNRAAADFAVTVEAVALLLESRWDDVHPRLLDGDDSLRRTTIERFNERLIVAALNNAPLFRSRRYGLVTWQTYAAAVRQASGDREDADTTSVDRILTEESLADEAPIAAAQALFGRLRGALKRIRTVYAERVAAGPPDLKGLTEALDRVCAMLDRVHPPPGVAEPAEGDTQTEAFDAAGRGAPGGASGSRAAFETAAAAAAGLAEATRYLHRTEPSSPALLLLRQAQALVGKTFLEAMEALLPDHVRRAGLSIAQPVIFNLPLTQLAERGVSPEAAVGEAEDRAPDGEGAEAPPAEPRAAPRAASRADALGLLDQVAAYYRSAEPSSPIPLLIERARALVGRDFMTLIRAILPENVLAGN